MKWAYVMSVDQFLNVWHFVYTLTYIESSGVECWYIIKTKEIMADHLIVSFLVEKNSSSWGFPFCCPVRSLVLITFTKWKCNFRESSRRSWYLPFILIKPDLTSQRVRHSLCFRGWMKYFTRLGVPTSLWWFFPLLDWLPLSLASASLIGVLELPLSLL